MKFKFGDCVEVNDEFYGKINGIVFDVDESEKYCVKFIKKIFDSEVTLEAWFDSRKIKLVDLP